MIPKVAFVVDALPGLGGSEKVLLAALELFPDAPIFTLVYNHLAFANTTIAARKVITSFIDRLPLVRTHYRKYLPLMPGAIEQFDLSAYDIILSFSYAVAHGVRTRPGQLHLSYTHTPMRYAWRGIDLNGTYNPANHFTDLLFRSFRAWDVEAVRRVDHLAAVSHWISEWIRRAYGRDSQVIYPPVDIERFHPQPVRNKYYITVSRLVRHKRIDLIVEAFKQLNLPLMIIGEGPEYSRLVRQASPNIQFLGFQNDSVVADLLNHARGFICACEEDFGIAAVEAQAAGCPVIAYQKGGAGETVLDGKTGLLFTTQKVDDLVETVVRFESGAHRFDIHELQRNAARFSKSCFQKEFERFVRNAWESGVGEV